MISQKSEFEFLSRGFKNSIVLIPGWATDCRVFSTVNLNYNYITVKRLNPFDFSGRLLQALDRKAFGRVSLFGWSLGAFLAVEFALNNSDRVNEVILLGARDKYEPMALEGVRQKIARNRKAYLFKFYHDCFSGGKGEDLKWFRKYLLKDYLNAMQTEDLMTGLDYFAQAEINTGSLSLMRNIRVFHGLEDKIAPVSKVRQMQSLLPDAEFIFIPDSGHVVFLSSTFNPDCACLPTAGRHSLG